LPELKGLPVEEILRNKSDKIKCKITVLGRRIHTAGSIDFFGHPVPKPPSLQLLLQHFLELLRSKKTLT